MKKHRLVAYARGHEEESEHAYEIPWSKWHKIRNILGSLAENGDCWIPTTSMSEIFKILKIDFDPASYEWCLQLNDAE